MASASLGYGQGIPRENVTSSLTKNSGTLAEHARLTGNDGSLTAILEKLEHDPQCKA